MAQIPLQWQQLEAQDLTTPAQNEKNNGVVTEFLSPFLCLEGEKHYNKKTICKII